MGHGGGGGAAAAVSQRLAAALRAPGPHHDALPPLAGLLLPALQGVIAAGAGGGNSGGGPLAAVAAIAAATGAGGGGGGGGAALSSFLFSSAPLLIQEMPTPLATALASMDWAGVAADAAAALLEGGKGGKNCANTGAGLLAVADALAAEPRLAGGGAGGAATGPPSEQGICVRVWARGARAASSASLAVRLVTKTGEEGEVVEVGGTAGSAPPPVRGRRSRLLVQNDDTNTLLLFPPAGRLLASVAGRALEATFQLPCGEAGGASLSALPPAVWLTAGLLATDGAALQLRLRRVGGDGADAVRVGGGWAAYACVGGALTVKE